MAKAKKSVFFCQNCGHEESKWLGQCPACREWNTFVEEKVTSVKAGTVRDKKEAQIVALSSVETDEDERMMTEMAELDPGAWRRNRTGISGAGPEAILESGIYASSAGVPEIGGAQTEAPVYFRGGVLETDQVAGRPHGNLYR